MNSCLANSTSIPARIAWRRLSVIVILLMAGAVACDQQGASPPVEDDEDDDPIEGETYQNPVLNRDFPDPSVLRAPNGTYYAYATETLIDGTFYNIQVAQSQDLVNWSWEGDALPGGVPWAQEGRSYWAPHVIYAPEQERYIMYFSAHHDEKGGKCLAVATADDPLGPFTHDGEPLRCGDGFANIDPMAFDDPETGDQYLYWGSHGEPIRVQPLAEDREHFEPGSESTPVVFPDADEPYGGLIEGAWVIHREGSYYLFYSGDNCCGENAHYAVMVARADQPTGPFEPLGDARGTGRSTILTADATWKAPGHNSIIRDAAGTDWIVYHAIDRDQPTRPTGTGVRWDRRVMLMDRLTYDGGWPRIEGGQPSAEARVPVVDESED